MTRRRAHLPAVILALAAGALLCSCQDDGPAGIEPDPDCIGPEGGVITETAIDSPLNGVSLGVAPEAWDQCWSVSMMYHSTFTTPNFPAGLVGYDGFLTGGLELDISRAIDLERRIEAPDSLEFELSFPLRTLTAEPGEKIMAFRFDAAAGIYRLEVPVRLDEERLTVKTHRHRPLWTWGKVDLEDVDFDLYLDPVMVELHGEGGWLEIQAELDRLQTEALADRRALTCEALRIVGTSLVAAGETAADNVRAIQNSLHGSCGVCDALTEAFYDELREYLRLQAQIYVTEFFLGNSKNVLVRIYQVIMCGYMQYCIAQLSCDYPCFADSVQLDFYLHLSTYYVCNAMAELIDWAMASGYVECS
ncbi:MAG: hypothetical protein R6X25_07035 [Candidatus Krumholzibacteriia bacterium]